MVVSHSPWVAPDILAPLSGKTWQPLGGGRCALTTVVGRAWGLWQAEERPQSCQEGQGMCHPKLLFILPSYFRGDPPTQ